MASEYDLVKTDILDNGVTFMNFENKRTKSKELVLTGKIASDLITRTFGNVDTYLFDFEHSKKFFLHFAELKDELKDFKEYTCQKGKVITLKPKKANNNWNFKGEIPEYGSICTITLKPGVWVNKSMKQYGTFFSILEIR